jgi:hypothetical protein
MVRKTQRVYRLRFSPARKSANLTLFTPRISRDAITKTYAIRVRLRPLHSTLQAFTMPPTKRTRRSTRGNPNPIPEPEPADAANPIPKVVPNVNIDPTMASFQASIAALTAELNSLRANLTSGNANEVNKPLPVVPPQPQGTLRPENLPNFVQTPVPANVLPFPVPPTPAMTNTTSELPSSIRMRFPEVHQDVLLSILRNTFHLPRLGFRRSAGQPAGDYITTLDPETHTIMYRRQELTVKDIPNIFTLLTTTLAS